MGVVGGWEFASSWGMPEEGSDLCHLAWEL
jgi:hypothetical protein